MGFVDTVKGTIKATTNIVTGKTASIAFETKGKLVPGEIVEMDITITPAGAPFESKGAFIELCGEDDLKETFVEKVRELVLLEGDPIYSIQVRGPFAVPGVEAKMFAAKFIMPADLDPARKWFMRVRVKTFGVDPVSPFRPIA